MSTKNLNPNLKVLSNNDLIIHTKCAVERERSAMIAVLDSLREIYTRRIHLELAYASMHEFCVQELQYSDGAAHRRIQAMKLCEEMPKAKEAIMSGTLSLSNAATLQNYFNKDGKTLPAKAKHDLLTQVQGRSKRECEKIFYPKQKGLKIECIVDDETEADLRRLSELLGIPYSDYAALIKRVASIARKKIDPVLKITKSRSMPVQSQKPRQRPAGSCLSNQYQGSTEIPKTASPENHLVDLFKELSAQSRNAGIEVQSLVKDQTAKRSRYISAALKKAVFIRDESQCTYISPITKRRCHSKWRPQQEHTIPFACGGPSDLDNLNLFCSAHNLHQARKVFGRVKIDAYAKARHQT